MGDAGVDMALEQAHNQQPLCSVTQAPTLQLHMQELVTLLGPRGSSKQALGGYVGMELTYCKGSTLRPGVSDLRGDAVTRNHGRGPSPHAMSLLRWATGRHKLSISLKTC